MAIHTLEHMSTFSLRDGTTGKEIVMVASCRPAVICHLLRSTQIAAGMLSRLAHLQSNVQFPSDPVPLQQRLGSGWGGMCSESLDWADAGSSNKLDPCNAANLIKD